MALDLQDTLNAHLLECVGLAANMIGVKSERLSSEWEVKIWSCLIRFSLKRKKPYQTEEGCLSLVGSRPTTRCEEISVAYRDMNWKAKTIHLSGFPAQICQHEMDHLEGIII